MPQELWNCLVVALLARTEKKKRLQEAKQREDG
jgi:hypothetical protein